MTHYSVMLKESIDALKIKSDGIYIDATLGRAGHSKEILKKLNEIHYKPVLENYIMIPLLLYILKNNKK